MNGPARRTIRIALLLLTASFASPAALLAEASQPQAALNDASRNSFQTFASAWMDRLHRSVPRSLVAVDTSVIHRVFGPEFRAELRATQDPRAPYLGVLRYTEHGYSCSNVRLTGCRLTQSTPIVEIFQFRDGRWFD